VLVASTALSPAFQINFTILGLRMFLGRPLYELTNWVVSLDYVFGTDASRLTIKLYAWLCRRHRWIGFHLNQTAPFSDVVVRGHVRRLGKEKSVETHHCGDSDGATRDSSERGG
jgi:hypothetical protein